MSCLQRKISIASFLLCCLMEHPVSASDIFPKSKPTSSEVVASWKKGIEYALWVYEKGKGYRGVAAGYIFDILKGEVIRLMDLSSSDATGSWFNYTDVNYGIRGSGPSDDEFKFIIKALYASAVPLAKNALKSSTKPNERDVYSASLASVNARVNRAGSNKMTKDEVMHSLVVEGLRYGAIDHCIAVLKPEAPKVGEIYWKGVTDYLSSIFEQNQKWLPSSKEVQEKVAYWRNVMSGTPDLAPAALAKEIVQRYGGA